MTILYDLIFLLFSIAYLPYLLFTGRYHKDFFQRFGLYPKEIIEGLKGKKIIWVHAVSVGEVMASRILCQTIVKNFPQKALVISTITKTGNDTAKRLFKERAVVLYLPVDISYALNWVFDKIKPQLFIIVETEIWPNLIMALHKRKVPIVLVNGRISPKSYRRYIMVKFLLKGILKKITLFCMQNEGYARRIEDMGAPKARIVITGNMKFDAACDISSILDRDTIRDDLNLRKEEMLFIAGSTHRPEEEIVLRVYKDLLRDYPNLRLLIAPRHIERTKELEDIIRRFGFKPVRISNIKDDRPSILILDKMGHLNRLFSIATIVFMGGSLMRKGGQNILEPAVFSKPIIFGPYMFNFKDIADEFLKEGAACMVHNKEELLQTTNILLKDGHRREELGSRAKSLMEKNKGATQRNYERIRLFINAK